MALLTRAETETAGVGIPRAYLATHRAAAMGVFLSWQSRTDEDVAGFHDRARKRYRGMFRCPEEFAAALKLTRYLGGEIRIELSRVADAERIAQKATAFNLESATAHLIGGFGTFQVASQVASLARRLREAGVTRFWFDEVTIAAQQPQPPQPAAAIVATLVRVRLCERADLLLDSLFSEIRELEVTESSPLWGVKLRETLASKGVERLELSLSEPVHLLKTMRDVRRSPEGWRRALRALSYAGLPRAPGSAVERLLREACPTPPSPLLKLDALELDNCDASYLPELAMRAFSPRSITIDALALFVAEPFEPWRLPPAVEELTIAYSLASPAAPDYADPIVGRLVEWSAGTLASLSGTHALRRIDVPIVAGAASWGALARLRDLRAVRALCASAPPASLRADVDFDCAFCSDASAALSAITAAPDVRLITCDCAPLQIARRRPSSARSVAVTWVGAETARTLAPVPSVMAALHCDGGVACDFLSPHRRMSRHLVQQALEIAAAFPRARRVEVRGPQDWTGAPLEELRRLRDRAALALPAALAGRRPLAFLSVASSHSSVCALLGPMTAMATAVSAEAGPPPPDYRDEAAETDSRAYSAAAAANAAAAPADLASVARTLALSGQRAVCSPWLLPVAFRGAGCAESLLELRVGDWAGGPVEQMLDTVLCVLLFRGAGAGDMRLVDSGARWESAEQLDAALVARLTTPGALDPAFVRAATPLLPKLRIVKPK